MEAIKAFLEQIKYAFQRSIHWLATNLRVALYKLSVMLLGQPRTDTYLSRFRAKYQAIGEYYSARVDRDSPYYRPIVRLWKIFTWGIFLAVFYIFSVETNFLWLMGSMPSVEDLQNPKISQSSEIYTSDGVMIGKFYTENRTPVPYEKISPNLINALIATEDIRFYRHSGIDVRAMAGVAAGIMTGATDRGGGSTVTQQLAKKLFKTRRSSARGLLGNIPGLRTLIYKTKEWLTAIKLERNFTKEEILTMYFNTVDFGNNTYGINTAAKSYFGKSPDSLNVQEAAVLVGLQKATTTYNPVRNQERSLERRNVVLAQMAKYNYLSDEMADSISKLPIELDLNFETPYDGNANYFKNAVVDDGLKIYTTIDSRMQTYAEKALEEKMRQLQRVFDDHWGKQNPWRDENGKEIVDFLENVVKRTARYRSLNARFPNQPDSINYYLAKKDTMTVYDWKTGGSMVKYWSPMDSLNYYKRILRAGMMAMDPYTGQIRAWAGGLDYNFFKYDHVKQGKRQPGSTFKPFVYTTAIDDSSFNMGPCDQLVDKPYSREMVINGKKQKWTPKNSTGYFTYSNMTLRRALAQSVNSITVQLTEQVGPANVVKYAKKLGISTPLRAEMGIGLGTFDVSLYDMVAAYAVFVNSGTYTEPVLVTRIEDQRGAVVEEFEPKRRQAISPESAFLMRHMLKGGIEEPGGTSRGLYNYQVGLNQGNEIDLGQGSRMALPLIGSFLEKVYKDKSLGLIPGPFPKPTVEITKEIQCTPPVIYRDTLEFEPDDNPFLPDEVEVPQGTPPPPPPLPDSIRRN
jgi:penicillin-binding protein 1A